MPGVTAQRQRLAGGGTLPLSIPDRSILDKLNETECRDSSKMKVHPGMLMKTKKGKFQVLGARCQGRDQRVPTPRSQIWTRNPRRIALSHPDGI